MKALAHIIILILFSNLLLSQVDSQNFTVYDADLDSTRLLSHFEYVECADLDNDGYTDIIAACIRNNNFKSVLMWFRNEGDLTFSEPTIIFNETGEFNKPFIDVGDIDNDGDIDIAFVSTENNSIVRWFENIDDANQFNEHFITDMFYENCGVLRDMDGDGDLDILTADTRYTEWYENTDGKGNFVLGERFYEYFDGSRHLIAGEDFDSDGDLDIIYWRRNSGTWATDDMYIHYNIDGLGTFSSSTLLTYDNPRELKDIELLDINQDGEKDIVICHGDEPTGFNGKIVWREVSDGVVLNTGGILASYVRGCDYIDKLDIDNDGDLDIISSAGNNDSPHDIGEFIIILNEGPSQFSDPIRIELDRGRLRKIKAADFDNDGKFELVSVSNSGVFGVGLDFVSNSTSNIIEEPFLSMPNPVSSELQIKLPNPIIDFHVEIFDINGYRVYSGKNKMEIDVEHFKKGTYLLYIRDDKSNKTWVQKVVKI
jgi:hypothetical protein